MTELEAFEVLSVVLEHPVYIYIYILIRSVVTEKVTTDRFLNLGRLLHYACKIRLFWSSTGSYQNGGFRFVVTSIRCYFDRLLWHHKI